MRSESEIRERLEQYQADKYVAVEDGNHDKATEMRGRIKTLEWVLEDSDE